MKKLIFSAVVFLIVASSIYSQSFTGDYFLGDQKVSITFDDEHYYIVYETGGSKRILQYEENTPENDQIWLEWLNAKQTGTLVLKPDYSSGIYTDYRTNQESYIKKRD